RRRRRSAPPPRWWPLRGRSPPLPSTPKKTGGSFLTKTVGPLTEWGWGAVGFAAFYFYRSGLGGSASSSGTSSGAQDYVLDPAALASLFGSETGGGGGAVS